MPRKKGDSSLSAPRTKQSTGPFATFDRAFDSALNLYSSSEEEEILSSAGIMGPKVERRQLRRQRRERRGEHRRRRHERRHRKRLTGSNAAGAANDEGDGATEEIVISSITRADEAPIAVMRRLVWPHLQKARRLFDPLQALQYLTGPWTVHSRYDRTGEGQSQEEKANYVAKLVSPSAPSLSGPRRFSADEGVKSLAMPDHHEWMLRPERRHRRCHSEQPRAWREPNPGLWTLAEE